MITDTVIIFFREIINYSGLNDVKKIRIFPSICGEKNQYFFIFSVFYSVLEDIWSDKGLGKVQNLRAGGAGGF